MGVALELGTAASFASYLGTLLVTTVNPLKGLLVLSHKKAYWFEVTLK